MRPAGAGGPLGFARPGRVVLILMGALVGAYVLELILLRAGLSELVENLKLTPAKVFERGMVWQPLTYIWLHDPNQPMHLFGNVLWLYIFGAPLLEWWGPKRFLVGYLIFALGGAALTLLVGLLSTTALLEGLLGGFYGLPHLGASGAVMGLTVAWGLTFANRQMNMLFLGPITGKTFVWIAVGVELVTALSYNPISSTSHFGGMIAAYVLTRGLWKPSTWAERFRRRSLNRQRKKLEHDLRIIEGGKNRPKDPREWN